MFFALSQPTGISFATWTFAEYTRQAPPVDVEQSLRISWLSFWAGGCLLFGLMPLWSTIVRKRMRLRYRNLSRYVLGWLIGELFCLYLLIETLTNPFSEVFAVYTARAWFGGLPFVFLFLEILQDELYYTSDSTSSVPEREKPALLRFLHSIRAKEISLSQVGLMLAAFVFAGIGVTFLFKPLEGASLVEIALPTAMARTDLRAAYGGFDLAFGVFLAVCALRTDWIRPGLAALALATAGFASGRIWGIAAEGTATWLMLSLTVSEIAAAGGALYLLRRRSRVPGHQPVEGAASGAAVP
jgi:hypothetical protein